MLLRPLEVMLCRTTPSFHFSTYEEYLLSAPIQTLYTQLGFQSWLPVIYMQRQASFGAVAAWLCKPCWLDLQPETLLYPDKADTPETSCFMRSPN